MKYVERWSEDMGHIIGYFEVADNHQSSGWEAECTKEQYVRNADQFKERKKKYNSSTVASHLLLKERSKATEELVRIINLLHVIKTTRSDEKPEMWVYKEGIYVPEGKSLIKEICRQILGEAHTNQLTNEVIAKIEADTYVNIEEFFNKQNEYPYLIPVENGLLDLKQKKLKAFDHKIPFFNKINAMYEPKADCPSIKKFLKQILGSDEDYDVIQEFIGFCLIKDYKYEKGFMLYGAQGRNGKGKLLELIKRFVGLDNISSIGLQDIETNGFVIANLHNKLVNICGDISPEALKHTGKYKELTGRDPQHADRKFKERIQFTNYAKMIFSCNELPPVYTNSDAFWMRWVKITFPFRFLPHKEFASLSNEEKKEARLQDPDIINKISSEEEMKGLLNFAIEGLTRLDKNLDFSNTATARELAKEWKRASNSVRAFIEDRVRESYDDYIPKGLFLKDYQAYCKKHRVNIMSDKTIIITLKEEFGIGKDDKVYVDGGQVRVWRRITWQ